VIRRAKAGRGKESAGNDVQIEPLAPDALYRRCDPAQLEFASTAELEPLDGVIGQERALAALRFGVGIRHENYHLFALGPLGIGKHAVVHQVLEQRAATEPVPSDWCYV
jgi:AAA domain